MVDAHRQMIQFEGTAAVEATNTKNIGSNPVLTTLQKADVKLE